MSASSGGGGDWLSRAEGLRPSEAAIRAFSAFILAIGGAAIMFMERLAAGLAGLLDILGSIRQLFSAFIESPIPILSQTSQYVGFVLTQGEWAFFGPATLAVGVFAIALAFWAWAVLDPPIPLPGFLDRIVNRGDDD